MRAILISRPGPPSVLTIDPNYPKPVPMPGEALIRIRAFGLNHAEMHMRRGEWAESVPISGIECVGTIASCPGGQFAPGAVVASLMGGLGRTRPGSYAEFTVAKVGNIVALAEREEGVRLSWAELAAIPESYAVAWTVLFGLGNLEVEKGQRLLIRGATSSLGRAAVNLAVEKGAVVTATARTAESIPLLEGLGVHEVIVHAPGRLNPDGLGKGRDKFDRVLELVGNSTVVESLGLVKRGGRVCLAGWLGGLDPIPGPEGEGMAKGFNPLLQMASGVHLSFFGSFVFGEEEFPLANVPLRDIVKSVAEGKFAAKPSRVFRFDEIQEAHAVMEAGLANGKMVVVIED
ncbi:quinone oxidoreductase PIG3 [Rhypophila decipiens]